MGRAELPELYGALDSSAQGLAAEEAAARLREWGPNTVDEEKRFGVLRRFLRTLYNPLVILLGFLASVSFATGDVRGGVVMTVMVALGILLRFTQEMRADVAAAKLKAMLHVRATVVRDGVEEELP